MDIERRPLHQQVAGTLRHRITSGDLGPGAALPSEHALQAEYGVSRATIRHALEVLTREGLIRRQAGKGSFVAPPPAEPESAGGARRCIGLVAAHLGSLFLMDVLRGVERVAEARGYDVVVANSNHVPEQERARVDRLGRRGVVGVLVEPVAGWALTPYYRSLVASGYPLVMLDRRLPDVAVDYVGIDNARATQGLVAHLFAAGHRRIAYLLGRDWPTTTAAERVAGYQAAYRAAGVPFDESLLFHLTGPPGDPTAPLAASMSDVVARLLDGPPEAHPTALCCVNDAVAAEALRAVRDRGLRVPEDLAIAGFDDLPYAAHLEVPLTTVAQPRERLGRTAARLLLDRVEGRRGARPATVLLPTRLLIRRSTDGAPAAARQDEETA